METRMVVRHGFIIVKWIAVSFSESDAPTKEVLRDKKKHIIACLSRIFLSILNSSEARSTKMVGVRFVVDVAEQANNKKSVVVA